MNRREFLFRVGGTLVAVPLVLEAIGCGNDTNPVASSTTEFTRTSSTNSGHAHTIRFVCTELSAHGGIPFTSSNEGGHVHEITLDATQLDTILTGGSVGPITSTNASGHTHTWTIQKPAGTC